MKVFDKIKSKNISELADWLDKYCMTDNSPWIDWFDNNYCNKCESEIVYVEKLNQKLECSWCELNDKCRYFQELDEVPDCKKVIEMWLESEG